MLESPAGLTGDEAPRLGCHCCYLLYQNCVEPAVSHARKMMSMPFLLKEGHKTSVLFKVSDRASVNAAMEKPNPITPVMMLLPLTQIWI